MSNHTLLSRPPKIATAAPQTKNNLMALCGGLHNNSHTNESNMGRPHQVYSHRIEWENHGSSMRKIKFEMRQVIWGIFQNNNEPEFRQEWYDNNEMWSMTDTPDLIFTRISRTNQRLVRPKPTRALRDRDKGMIRNMEEYIDANPGEGYTKKHGLVGRRLFLKCCPYQIKTMKSKRRARRGPTRSAPGSKSAGSDWLN
jgi:hypothetical protein